jgi:DNA-binding CsgD family transcriptional regulator/tetratricopeptide (TPR) repeat protein
MGLTIAGMGLAEPLEREAELTQLSALLTAAQRGRGRTCVVEGPSGVGKSRLLDECARAAEGLEMSVLRARCSELTRDHPFGVVRTLLEPTLVRADAETRAKLMHGPAAMAEPVFGPREAFDEFGVIHGLYWLTVNIAEQQPVLVLVDDVLWADDFSLRYLAYLADRIDDIPAAVVVAIRHGDPGADSSLIAHLSDAAGGRPIRPANFSEAAVRALLTAELPERDVDADLTETVLAETGGNPYLVVAVADAIRAGEVVGATTPDSVRRQITRRLSRLHPAAQTLAKAASVLSDEAALTDAVRLAGLRPDEGRAAADELIAAHILTSADPIVFAHRIVRMTIHELLPPRKRTAFHAHAAKLLAANRTEPEVVAEHLLLSGPLRDAWSVSALHEAGRSAARKGAPTAAVRYLRSALDVADDADPPPEVLVDLCLAEASAGETTSLARFTQALQRIREPGQRADALYSFGQTLYRFGRYAEAGNVFRQGAALFEDSDRQVRLRFEAAAFGAEYHLSPEQHGPLSAADGTGPGDRAVLAVHALRKCLMSPPASTGADMAIRALDDGTLLAELTSRSPVVSLAVLALLHSGRLVEAHEAADAVVLDARGRGAPMAYAEASLSRALVLLARGRITEAAVDAQTALDRMGSHAHARTAAATLANCMIERHELTEAASVLDKVEETPPPVDVPGVEAFVYLARGRLHLGLRDIEAARSDLAAAEKALQVFGDANPSALPWRSLAGVIAHLSGDPIRANALIQEEIRLAQHYEVPIALGVALRRRAMTEHGQQALDTLREAITVLQPTEAKLELAHALSGLGRGLRRAGHRVEARRHLTIGLDLAHRCGASGLESDIREELTVAGARPRRPALSGIDSLTPTELRVAQLAAQGGSNRYIAETIFVSRNTVAWHLRNVYRKLEIDSREQLTQLVDA